MISSHPHRIFASWVFLLLSSVVTSAQTPLFSSSSIDKQRFCGSEIRLVANRALENEQPKQTLGFLLSSTSFDFSRHRFPCPSLSHHPFSLRNTSPRDTHASGRDCGLQATSVSPQTQPSGETEELAKKVSNPVSSLISFPFQENFDFNMGTGSGWRFTMNIQPVVPVQLSPKWNLISRTILPVIHQHNVAGPGNQSGLGDITQSFFFSPADSKRLIWAVGPVFLIPTATDHRLGTQKFGIGPTALALKQEKGWTYGMLVNHIWSVAGSDSRASVNSTFLQPFLAYNTKFGWTYTLNAESSYDWTGNSWSVPIHFTITKLMRFGKQPVSLGGGIRCWATSPEGGPENCGLRVIVQPLFPKG